VQYGTGKARLLDFLPSLRENRSAKRVSVSQGGLNYRARFQGNCYTSAPLTRSASLSVRTDGQPQIVAGRFERRSQVSRYPNKKFSPLILGRWLPAVGLFEKLNKLLLCHKTRCEQFTLPRSTALDCTILDTYTRFPQKPTFNIVFSLHDSSGFLLLGAGRRGSFNNEVRDLLPCRKHRCVTGRSRFKR
jgi:hypothetical protein